MRCPRGRDANGGRDVCFPSTGPFEGIAFCVRVTEWVDNYREQVHICTESYLQGAGTISTLDVKLGEPFLKGVLLMTSNTITHQNAHDYRPPLHKHKTFFYTSFMINTLT